MSDLRFALVETPAGWFADLQLDGAALAREDGLETAVLISLFTDARAPEGAVPAGADRRGWWGNRLPSDGAPRDWQRGSLLWLLAREKRTEETARRAREYAEAALAWLVEDGAASAVAVEAAWLPPPAPLGALALRVRIARADGTVRRFEHVWNAQANRVERRAV